MYSLIQRDILAQSANGSTSPNGAVRQAGLPALADEATHGQVPVSTAPKEVQEKIQVPAIFTDPGYNLLGTSVLSTSNCGNPALRLFGFGPVTPEGYGIGKSSHISYLNLLEC